MDLEKDVEGQLAIGEDGVDSDDDKAGLKIKGIAKDNSNNKYGKNYYLEEELDAAYNWYLSNTNDGMAKSGINMEKRTKKLQRQKTLYEAREDMPHVLTTPRIQSPRLRD